MKCSVLIFINLIGFITSRTNFTLCNDVPSFQSNSTQLPTIVILREHNSNHPRMNSAMDDVDCWLQKSFKISESHTVNTKGKDNETICYSISTVSIKPTQLMVVVTEGQSAQNCTPSIYGPIPNILNIKMFIDGTKNDSARHMELSLRNTGGHIGVQFELHRASVGSKIQKTMSHMMTLSNKSLEYSKLIPFWNSRRILPPKSFQNRKIAEEKERIKAEKVPISWFLWLSVVPMILAGIAVSSYIVFQPRGGLTYTDEEVAFTIQEVDSASRVNVVQPDPMKFPIAPIAYADVTPPDHTTTTNTALTSRTETDVRTCKSPDVHTDKTVYSESTKTVRQAPTIITTAVEDGVSVDTITLKE